MEPLVPQALIFMLHNKMPEVALVYVALVALLTYGMAETHIERDFGDV